MIRKQLRNDSTTVIENIKEKPGSLFYIYHVSSQWLRRRDAYLSFWHNVKKFHTFKTQNHANYI